MTETIMKESFAVDMYNQYAYYRCREFINAKNFKAKKNILGIFGLKNVGKTRLLKKVEECLIKEKVDVKFVSATELIGKISEARKSKDVFLRKLKKEFRNAEVVLIDGVQELFGDDKIHDTYNRFYSYLMRHRKSVVFTHDCGDERMYSTMQGLSELDMSFNLVGIPKPGQNRNVKAVEIIEA